MAASTKKLNDEFNVIICALRIYKQKYGNFSVPYNFIIPKYIFWSKRIWGFELGIKVKEIRNSLSKKTKFINFLEGCNIYDEFKEVFRSVSDAKWQDTILPALKNYYRLHQNLNVPTNYICPFNDENWPCVNHWGLKLGVHVKNIRIRNNYSKQVLSSAEELKEIKFGEADTCDKSIKQTFGIISKIETEHGITVGIGRSGIKNAGYGAFNLSGSIIRKNSIICRYEGKIINEEVVENNDNNDIYDKVVQIGDLGESFILANKTLMEVQAFKEKYANRIRPYSAYLSAEGKLGGYFNDNAYGTSKSRYWMESKKKNNCVLIAGCEVDENSSEKNITVNKVYVMTWKDIHPNEEFFLAYGNNF